MSIDIREDYQKNYIINGNFDVWQRGTSQLLDGQTLYLPDRFFGADDSDGSFTISRSTDVPNANSTYSLQAEVTSTDAALTTTQVDLLGYRMEGYDLQMLRNRTFTVSFYVKSSITGTYGLAFRNDASDRSYPTTYTINQANVWEKKEITLTHDDTGVWEYTNGIGMRISWMLACGPDYQTTTLNQWQAGIALTDANQTNWIGNAGATFKVSQVQINLGGRALPFRRAGKTFAEELALCHRYYFEHNNDSFLNNQIALGRMSSTTRTLFQMNLPQPMRVDEPTLDFAGVGDFTVQVGTGAAQVLTSLGARVPKATSAQFTLDAFHAATGAAGQVALLNFTFNGSDGAYLGFDAEL